MDLKTLQKKYPRFVYNGFSWKYVGGDIAVIFDFIVEPDLRFAPRLVIENVLPESVKKIGEEGLDYFIFNLGLAEIPSYWKATCAKEIVVKCGYLDAGQIRFWSDLISNGMGQFFYENNLARFVPSFKIETAKPKIYPRPASKRFSPDFLVPVGGGKDALVTYEALKAAKKNIATFVLNENAPLKRLVKAIGTDNISVKRTIDPGLFELKKQGYLNGHTPFSSYLAILCVVIAALFDKKYIAISQERSSSEGNVEYRGQKVNHQYSKSFEFEKKFRAYSKKYLAKNIDFFSSLRPLYEIQIAKIFSGFPKYFPYFLSCNKPYRITDSSETTWCKKCPKCLFTFAALYPFCEKEQLIKIFWGNLFEDGALIPLMEELVGEVKPFECVGTRLETVAAFYLSLKKEMGSKNLPVLLEYFKNNILDRYPGIEKQTDTVLTAWDKHNFVPIS
ncbi:MAG: hypothetical protein NTX14_00390, partial [Candidatus Nealsonbacteria bacterium]|nr:hypothetical protein [Candidatus Nealsonbacteria bacterium]